MPFALISFSFASLLIIGIQISLNLFDVLFHTSLTKQKMMMILLFRNFYYYMPQNVMIDSAVFLKGIRQRT